MAKKVIKRSKTVDKWKTKKWFTLIAPKSFNLKEIGETPAQKPQTLIGRVIETNLDQLSGNRKLRHINLKFKVTEVQEQKAYTKIYSHIIKIPYIKRFVRRKRSKIDSVLTIYTKANEKVRVSATTICTKKLNAKEETSIRKIMETQILNLVKRKKNYDEMVQDLIFGATASEILKKAKEIARIKRVEITKSRVLEG